jgi:hypothetical protein
MFPDEHHQKIIQRIDAIEAELYGLYRRLETELAMSHGGGAMRFEVSNLKELKEAASQMDN